MNAAEAAMAGIFAGNGSGGSSITPIGDIATNEVYVNGEDVE